MHSFFIEQIPAAGETAELEKSERDHLFRTLRARTGDPVRLLDGQGSAAEAEVAAGHSVTVRRRQTYPEPTRKLILCCAAPRRQKLDILLKQMVELGVWEINLIHFHRSVAQPEGSNRWDALLKEAAKQSGNPFLPRIRVFHSLASLLEDLAARRAALFWGAVEPTENKWEIPAAETAWLVGPEGGLTSQEEDELIQFGARPLSLGPWILRLETAAVGGIAALRLAGDRG